MTELKEGLAFTSKQTVETKHLASSVGSGDMDVFATPAMIALMENAAMLCISKHLEDGQSSVGISIGTTHIKATAPNKEVEATATITIVEGRKVTFTIVARDNDGIIGEGTHERFIVNKDKFLSKL